MNQVQGVLMERFKEKEFRGWTMSKRLLVCLDLFALKIGLPVHVSTAKGAIGRDGAGTSQHFWEEFGEVRAIDIQPEGLTLESAERYIEIAKECGFAGIGLYPQWLKPGLHLDVRDTNDFGNPATWGAVYTVDEEGDIEQIYVTIEEALNQWP